MLLLLAGTLSLLSAGCQQGSAPQGFERPPAPVTVASAIARGVPVYIDAIGKCAPVEVVTIQPQVSGRITAIHFVDGSELKKGQPLFTIDPRPFEAELAAAEATLAQRRAALDLARIEFARIADLIESRAIARQDYDAKKNAIAVGEAQVQQSEAAIQAARLNLEYTSIASPIDGRAGERLVDVGNVVSANDTSLLVIQRLDPIYAEFTITESELGRVQRELARGALRVEVRLPEEPEAPRSGRITYIATQVEENTGTVMVRATLDNSDRRFWPGRFVKVRLILDTVPGAVLIPAAATQMSANGPFVYVVQQDSTAELRPVALGQRQDDLIVIQQGVSEGERVVVTGQLAVMPGGPVRVEEPPATGPQQTAGGNGDQQGASPAAAEDQP
jgi:multidrug efflux system membrane fusion protein